MKNIALIILFASYIWLIVSFPIPAIFVGGIIWSILTLTEDKKHV